MANSITTTIARGKFAKAHAEGIALPKITQIGWGEGGVDDSGNILLPSANQTVVAGEFFRNNIISFSYADNNLTVIFNCSLLSTEVGVVGKKLSSIGLYDEAGDLIAVKNFGIKTIDEDTRIDIPWHEEF